MTYLAGERLYINDCGGCLGKAAKPAGRVGHANAGFYFRFSKPVPNYGHGKMGGVDEVRVPRGHMKKGARSVSRNALAAFAGKTETDLSILT